ncbi:MAG: hypothetical protein SPL12_09615 [Bacteroidales bacterium]|nr:hypothetical protein [Bacteroidales bacterium]
MYYIKNIPPVSPQTQAGSAKGIGFAALGREQMLKNNTLTFIRKIEEPLTEGKKSTRKAWGEEKRGGENPRNSLMLKTLNSTSTFSAF